MKEGSFKSHIKSFVPRRGRISDANQQVLAQLAAYQTLNFDDFASTTLEIGFGNGDNLIHFARQNPDILYIGVEVYTLGVAQLIRKVQDEQLSNVRIFQQDVVTFLQDKISAPIFQQVFIYFPDPWPKLRHHKRRIVRPDFLALLASKMLCGATLHLATDWEHYAEHMLKVLEATQCFTNLNGPYNFAKNVDTRIETKFARRGKKLGYMEWDLIYQKN